MTSRSSNDETTDPGAMDISADPPLLQQAMDDSEMVSSTESGLAANVLSVSNVPSISTPNFLSAPVIRPTTVATQSAAQPQSLTPVQEEIFLLNITRLVVKDWVPCVLSPAQIQHYRLDTRNQVQKICDLEAKRKELFPAKSQPIEGSLFMARLDYKIRFWRIFRINDLPPEILTNIFRCFVGSTADNVIQYGLYSVSWVCRHWREVALSDPILWNVISFKDECYFERSFTWFERSADSPLVIRIDDSKQRPFSLEAVQNLLIRIFDKISTIRVITIFLQDWDTILFVLRAFCVVQEKNLPMLMERFEIHCAGSPHVQIGAGYENRSYLQPIPLFGGATVPSLKYLYLDGVHIDWANSVLTDLTNIAIRRIPLEGLPSLSQFRALLDGSPALKQIILDRAGPTMADEEVIREMKPIHIPSLKGLFLGDFTVDYALYICSHISAPNVLDLTMMNLIGDDYLRLYDFLRSKMPSIKILNLYNIDPTPNQNWRDSFIRWLQSMPQVTFLRIRNIKPQILELFLYDYETMTLTEGNAPSARIPCPKLAFLDFGDVQTEVIIKWARIRGQLGSPLREVYFEATLTRQQHQELAIALDGGTIHHFTGSRSAEEEELLGEVF